MNARAPSNIPAFDERTARTHGVGHRTAANVVDQDSLTVSLARLKKSIELGSVGEVVKQTDVLPGGIYETLGKVGEVFAKPEKASRFLSYPGVTELIDNPKFSPCAPIPRLPI